MKVKFPLTISTTFTTPFSSTDAQGNKIPQVGAQQTYEAEIDSADILALFPSTGATAHLTAAQLRAQYSDLELLAALQAPKA